MIHKERFVHVKDLFHFIQLEIFELSSAPNKIRQLLESPSDSELDEKDSPNLDWGTIYGVDVLIIDSSRSSL